MTFRSTSYIPGHVQGALRALSHLTLSNTVRNQNNYYWMVNDENEFWGGSATYSRPLWPQVGQEPRLGAGVADHRAPSRGTSIFPTEEPSHQSNRQTSKQKQNTSPPWIACIQKSGSCFYTFLDTGVSAVAGEGCGWPSWWSLFTMWREINQGLLEQILTPPPNYMMLVKLRKLSETQLLRL